MPWQRHVCDVAFEHDDAGLCVYRYFVLIVPRQAGKSSLCEAIMVWAALHRRNSNVVYSAQTREFARVRVIEELEMKRLQHSPFAPYYHPYRSRGAEQLHFNNGTRISLVSTTEDAGHGLTLDMAIVDEAWSHKDFTMIDALDPTMITRPDPMFVITSTVGEGDDALLMHFQELGRAETQRDAAENAIAFFEWSAPDDAPLDDPAVWRATHPALGHTITEERLQNRLQVLHSDQFARHYLCRRPARAEHAIFDVKLWNSRGNHRGPDASQPVALAVDVTPERRSGTIAACAKSDRGGYVVAVDRRTGVDWIVPAVQKLTKQRHVIVGVVDGLSGSPALALVDAIEACTAGVEWKRLNTAQVVKAAGQFYDDVRADPPLLWHCNQPELDRAVAYARKRQVGEAFAWGRKGTEGDVTPLVAATLARFGYVEHERSYAGDLFIY